jgi:plastocyanin
MNKKYFFSLFVLISSIVSIAISCGKSSYSSTPTPPAGGGGTGADAISIYGMSFSPASLTVAKGTVVKWTNNDSYAHTATSNDGTTFDSKTISGGGVYSYTAITAGTFEYHCTIHGVSMSGTLIVNP